MVATLFLSCNTDELGKEIRYEEYKGTWGVPVGTHAEDFLGIFGDIFTDNMRLLGSDEQDNARGIIYYRFEQSFERHIIDDLVRLPFFENSLRKPHIGVDFISGSTLSLPESERKTPFVTLGDGVDLRSFTLIEGHVLLTMEAVYHANFEITFSIPALTDSDGNVLRRDFLFPYSETQGMLTTQRVLLPIHGYKFTVDTDSVGDKTFEIAASWKVTHVPSVSISTTDYFRVIYSVEPEKVGEMEGFFGAEKRMLLFGRDVQIMLQDAAMDMDFSTSKFEDITLKIAFRNPHTIPMALDSGRLSFLSLAKDASYTETPIVPNDGNLVPLFFVDKSEPAGTVKETMIFFDRSTANLDDIVSSNSLYALKMPFFAILNPPVPHPQEQNNIVRRLPIEVDVIFDVPYDMILNDVVKTFEYDNEYKEDARYFDVVTLRFLTKNDIPFRGHLNVFFVDDKGARIYATNDKVLFGAPEINEQGEVTAPYVGLDEIELDSEGTLALAWAEMIHVDVVMNSSEYRGQQYYALFKRSQQVEITVSMRAALEVEQDEL